MLVCSEVRDRFSRYASEELPAEERASVRQHLAGCRDCVREAAETDPTLLFAVPGSEIVTSEETQAILSAVRSGIAWKQAERRLEAGGPRRRAVAAAAGLLALLLALPGSSGRRPVVREARRSPQERRAPASIQEHFAPVAHPAAATNFPADATVYDWKPGGGAPRVVWIVDRSLDI